MAFFHGGNGTYLLGNDQVRFVSTRGWTFSSSFSDGSSSVGLVENESNAGVRSIGHDGWTLPEE
jgi:hypothetical protein